MEYYDPLGQYTVQTSENIRNKYGAYKSLYKGDWKIVGNLLCYDMDDFGEGCVELYRQGSAISFVDPTTGTTRATSSRINSPNLGRGERSVASARPPVEVPPAKRPVEAPPAKRNVEPSLADHVAESTNRTQSGPELYSSGTGFVVSEQTYVITNDHVIDDCEQVYVKIDGGGALAVVAARDEGSDLALLKLPPSSQTTAVFRTGDTVRPGDSVVGLGFPLRGLLASQPNVTVGTVSALAGVGNDFRFLQISAPVQPGNSGGPLLDQSGNVVGIIVSRLNAMVVAAVTGDLPQNVNFAVKETIAKLFLEANDVDYSARRSYAVLSAAEIAENAKAYTVPVECWK